MSGFGAGAPHLRLHYFNFKIKKGSAYQPTPNIKSLNASSATPDRQAARNDKERTRKERGKSKERASDLVDFDPKLVENHAEIHPPQGTIRNL